ncbi:hypothetical protein [Sinomonas albida]|uniref:hypothetical protein n=1 Tax=Sinomonas albida TaxID=369942 RepID=UPI003019A545
MSKTELERLAKALQKAEAGGNVGAIVVAKQALQLGLTKALLAKGDQTLQETKAALNQTEADGASQIDGVGYGDDSRQIPGTNTVQSPVQLPIEEQAKAPKGGKKGKGSKKGKTPASVVKNMVVDSKTRAVLQHSMIRALNSRRGLPGHGMRGGK